MERLSCRLILPLAQVDDMPEQTVRVHSTKRSRVHWVRPEMVAEVSYVEWTPDGLLRHVVYLGERQDKLANEVFRSRPHTGEA